MALEALLALAAAAMFAFAQAQAQPRDRLVDMINAYRAAPPSCNGKPSEPLGPLAQQPVLARVQVGTGVFLEHALERIGYPVAQAEMIYLTGPQDANAVMEAIGRRYCRTLLSPQFSAIGTSRSGDAVNLELDMIAKYVRNLVAPYLRPQP